MLESKEIEGWGGGIRKAPKGGNMWGGRSRNTRETQLDYQGFDKG